jgi:hypothetical protein
LNVAKKSRRENTAGKNCRGVGNPCGRGAEIAPVRGRRPAIEAAQRNINKENEFRGAFDSNLTASGAGM